jgi:hypothetical protein
MYLIFVLRTYFLKLYKWDITFAFKNVRQFNSFLHEGEWKLQASDLGVKKEENMITRTEDR